MANEERLAILRQGVKVWNDWRANDLRAWDEDEVDLTGAELFGSHLSGADLKKANLAKANLKYASLSYANLSESNLMEANLQSAALIECDLTSSNLQAAYLFVANLNGANLSYANLSGANLDKADLRGAILRATKLTKANLQRVDLRGADLSGADLSGADLEEADLSGTNLRDTNFFGANLSGVNLSESNIRGANLSEAELSGANLTNSNLVQTNVNNAKISRSNVYGVNVWDLNGDFREQKDLIITPSWQPPITVDNIKVAQFIYLILHNGEIRDVINTLTSKSVLILGRFAVHERKSILDTLRNKLREYDLLPIVFDFDRPTDKDFTETIKTLAGLCYFVIADVTNPKSSPLELQATVPDYQIPFVPIIQEGEQSFAMMVDLQKKYNWVLNTITYDSAETLVKILKPLIIDPAMKKRQELRIIKAQEPEVISGKSFLEKGKE